MPETTVVPEPQPPAVCTNVDTLPPEVQDAFWSVTTAITARDQEGVNLRHTSELGLKAYDLVLELPGDFFLPNFASDPLSRALEQLLPQWLIQGSLPSNKVDAMLLWFCNEGVIKELFSRPSTEVAKALFRLRKTKQVAQLVAGARAASITIDPEITKYLGKLAANATPPGWFHTRSRITLLDLEPLWPRPPATTAEGLDPKDAYWMPLGDCSFYAALNGPGDKLDVKWRHIHTPSATSPLVGARMANSGSLILYYSGPHIPPNMHSIVFEDAGGYSGVFVAPLSHFKSMGIDVHPASDTAERRFCDACGAVGDIPGFMNWLRVFMKPDFAGSIAPPQCASEMPGDFAIGKRRVASWDVRVMKHLKRDPDNVRRPLDQAIAATIDRMSIEGLIASLPTLIRFWKNLRRDDWGRLWDLLEAKIDDDWTTLGLDPMTRLVIPMLERRDSIPMLQRRDSLASARGVKRKRVATATTPSSEGDESDESE